MAHQDSRDTLVEYRDQALVIMRRARVTEESLTVVKQAESSAQLVLAINTAIVLNDISGRDRNDLVTLQQMVKALDF